MSDKENVKMKNHKPPPPIPPRPSKFLIQEALAKTRQGHATYVNSVPKCQSHEKSQIRPPYNKPSPTPLQEPETNNKLFYNRHNVVFDKPQRQAPMILKDTERPVVYQSKNCKSRPVSPEGKKQPAKEAKGTALPSSETKINENVNNVKLEDKTKLSQDLDRKISTSGESVISENEHNFKTKEKCNKLEDRGENEMKNLTELQERVCDKKTFEPDTGKKSSDEEVSVVSSSRTASPEFDNNNDNSKNWDDILNNRNHVNTLIDEMFASVLEVNLSNSTSRSSSRESIIKESDNKITISNKTNPLEEDNLTVIVINDSSPDGSISNTPASDTRSKVKFNDQENHEFLISELQKMKYSEEKILKRQRLPSSTLDENESVKSFGSDKIQMNDWYGVNEGKKVRMSSCHIKIDDPCAENERISEEFHQKIKSMSRVYGLPPLPKSLSRFNFTDPIDTSEKCDSVKPNQRSKEECNGNKVSSKEETHLDRQLALLRREMDGLREQDLSLLSKLWFLNESIQDFRLMLQDQEDKNSVLLSPSPTPSSIDDEEYYVISASTC